MVRQNRNDFWYIRKLTPIFDPMYESSNFFQSLVDMKVQEKDYLQIVKGIDYAAFLPYLYTFLISQQIEMYLRPVESKKQPLKVLAITMDVNTHWWIILETGESKKVETGITLDYIKIR